MTKEALALLEQVRALPPEDLAEFTDALHEHAHTDPEWEKAWGEEAQRRIERLRSGEDQAIPAEEVFREMEERYP